MVTLIICKKVRWHVVNQWFCVACAALLAYLAWLGPTTSWVEIHPEAAAAWQLQEASK